MVIIQTTFYLILGLCIPDDDIDDESSYVPVFFTAQQQQSKYFGLIFLYGISILLWSHLRLLPLYLVNKVWHNYYYYYIFLPPALLTPSPIYIFPCLWVSLLARYYFIFNLYQRIMSIKQNILSIFQRQNYIVIWSPFVVCNINYI